MKGHIPDLHALGLDGLQQLRREVEPRRGGGGAAQHLGVHGLVPLLVLELLLDVGGQGHFPQPLQGLQEDALVVEPDQAAALLQLLHDLGGQLPVAEGEPGALAELPARADQALPHLVAPVVQQQHLADAAAGQPLAHQTGGQHPGVVQDQTVAGVQEIRQVIEMVVSRGAAHPVQRHQAGGVPLLDGGLGDQLLGQIIVKITGLHALSFSLPDTDAGEIKFQNIDVVMSLLRHGLGAVLAHADVVAVSGAGDGDAVP